VYRALIEAFAADCVRRIHEGSCLNDAEARAFHILLEARELAGHRLLGPYAGPDPSFDTVTGRCGHAPVPNLS
jgi:hypothetical protein